MPRKHWKQPKPPKESLRQSLARAAEELNLQAGPVLDLPELQCSQRGVLMERHHGVLEYTTERIRVAARGVVVQITGMNLQLQAMSAGELNVRGDIAGVEFIRQ